MVDIKKLFKSFGYAFEGIESALRYNQNLRIHFLAAVLVILAGFVLRVSPYEMSILALVILLVLCAEMINTAIEEVVDLLVNEHRKEAKIAKDVSAGMVLLTAIGAVIIGIMIFLPHIQFFVR